MIISEDAKCEVERMSPPRIGVYWMLIVLSPYSLTLTSQLPNYWLNYFNFFNYFNYFN